MFSSMNFIVFAFKFQSLIQFELNFLYVEMVGVQFHSFACGYPVVSAPLVERTILSPQLMVFGTLVKID